VSGRTPEERRAKFSDEVRRLAGRSFEVKDAIYTLHAKNDKSGSVVYAIQEIAKKEAQ